MKCSFCDRNAEIMYPVVKEVKNGKIIFEKYENFLPVCTKCFEEKKYPWIEKILDVKFHDGWKRITNLVLLPYLLNIREMPDDDVYSIVMDWYKINKITRLRNDVLGEIRYVKMRKYKPLRKEKFIKMFGDFDAKR